MQPRAHTLAALLALLQLALSSLLSEAAASATEGGIDEAAVLRHLREALHEAGQAAVWHGWMRLNDTSHPCAWSGVACAANGSVAKLTVLCRESQSDSVKKGTLPAVSAAGPLLPELARLPLLQELEFTCPSLSAGAIPPEWGTLGAWPSLRILNLAASKLAGSLPDIQPGALPLLQHMLLHVPKLRATLPASWGGAGVLPSLRRLELTLAVRGPLPAGWAGGSFRRLEQLSIAYSPIWAGRSIWMNGGSLEEGRRPEAAPLLGTPQGVPDEWAAPGSFPSLALLHLGGLGIAGPLPRAVVEGTWPALQELNLIFNNISGTLPPQLFARNPRLRRLWLGENRLQGPLPAAWANSSAEQIELYTNDLTGPAFPPGWLVPGSFPQLQLLRLGANAGLTGTLPATLPWPKLELLGVDGTAMHGSIPATWCNAPFAKAFNYLWVDRTRITPRRPACAWEALAHLTVYPQESSSAAAAFTALPQQPAAVAAAACLAAAAPLAALAAAVLWRQRRLASTHASAVYALRNADAVAGEAQRAAGQPPCAVGEQAARRRRLQARLATCLRTEGGRLELLPPNALPAVLAHNLSRSAARHADVHERDRRQQTRPEQSRQPLLAERAAPCQAGAEHASGVAAGAQCRQWGLPTESLRLDSGWLELVVDRQGQLVELGAGSHAVCYLARLQGSPAAVKVFELDQGSDSRAPWHEVSLLHACTHRRVVPLLGVALRGDLLVVAMRLMEGGSLGAALQCEKARGELRWGARGWQVAQDIAEALAFLHGRGVLHGDLKPGNILLSHDRRGFIADLGMARVLGSTSRAAGFTRLYAAPEQLLGSPCTLAADIYALGMLLVVLASRRLLSNRGEWALPRAPRDCPEDVVRLIERCIAPQPDQRPSAAEVLRLLRAAQGCEGCHSAARCSSAAACDGSSMETGRSSLDVQPP